MTRNSASSFSSRFHILCDHAQFVVGRGRQTEVARFFNVGQTTARNWLIEGICPRDETLHKIITRLQRYDRLPDHISPKALHVWLEKGSSYIPNPFDDTASDLEIHEYDLLRLYKIFSLISTKANEMSVDIDSFPKDEVSKLLAELCDEKISNIGQESFSKMVCARLESLMITRA